MFLGSAGAVTPLQCASTKGRVYNAVGVNEEPTPKPVEHQLSDGSRSEANDEQVLFDAVLRETMERTDQAALELIFSVARKSSYPDTSRVEAVEELVRAIMKARFGARKFTRRLIHRIACSLIETPEATIRMERLWQEGRSGG
jgi:hypothetical protein